MKNFRTYQLALELYKKSRELRFPSAEMKDQFERAILSVTLNLAEGSGRSTAKDRRRFYVMSLGSLREIQAIFDLLSMESFVRQADILAASLFRLTRNPGATL
jgi:four helix bundle protein